MALGGGPRPSESDSGSCPLDDPEDEATHHWVVSVFANALISSCLITLFLSASESFIAPLLPGVLLRSFDCDSSRDAVGSAVYLAVQALAGVMAAWGVGSVSDRHGRKPVLVFICIVRMLPCIYLALVFDARTYFADTIAPLATFNPWVFFAIEWTTALLGGQCTLVVVDALLADLIPTRYQSASILAVVPFTLAGRLAEPFFVAVAASPSAAAAMSLVCCAAALISALSLPNLWRERRRMRIIEVSEHEVPWLDDDHATSLQDAVFALRTGSPLSPVAPGAFLVRPRAIDGPGMIARVARRAQREMQTAAQIVRMSPSIGLLMGLTVIDVLTDFDLNTVFTQYATSVIGFEPRTHAQLSAVHSLPVVLLAFGLFPLLRVKLRVKDHVILGWTFVATAAFAVAMLGSPTERSVIYGLGTLAGLSDLSTPLLEALVVSVVGLSHRGTALGMRESASFVARLIGPLLFLAMQIVIPPITVPPAPHDDDVPSSPLTPHRHTPAWAAARGDDGKSRYAVTMASHRRPPVGDASPVRVPNGRAYGARPPPAPRQTPSQRSAAAWHASQVHVTNGDASHLAPRMPRSPLPPVSRPAAIPPHMRAAAFADAHTVAPLPPPHVPLPPTASQIFISPTVPLVLYGAPIHRVSPDDGLPICVGPDADALQPTVMRRLASLVLVAMAIATYGVYLMWHMRNYHGPRAPRRYPRAEMTPLL